MDVLSVFGMAPVMWLLERSKVTSLESIPMDGGMLPPNAILLSTSDVSCERCETLLGKDPRNSTPESVSDETLLDVTLVLTHLMPAKVAQAVEAYKYDGPKSDVNEDGSSVKSHDGSKFRLALPA